MKKLMEKLPYVLIAVSAVALVVSLYFYFDWGSLSNLFVPLFLFYVVGPTMFFIVLFSISTVARFTDLLVIRPNRFRPDDYDATNVDGVRPTYKPDTFGIFTNIEDGRAMIKVIGETFINAFMNAPGLSFKGHLDKSIKRSNPEEYYAVVKTPKGKRDSNPLTGYSWFSWKTLAFGTYHTAWRLWETATYKWYGLVFVGLWPIVTLKTYALEYFEEAKTAEGEFKLKRQLNYSNHFRVFDFQFYIPMDSLDTADLIPVKAMLSEIMRVVNVYRIGFRSDNKWGSRLFARIPSVVNEETNGIPVQNIIASQGSERLTAKLDTVLRRLTDEGGPLYEIGLAFAPDSLTLPDRSVKNEQDEIALGEVARAEINRKAREKVADGEAYAIRKSKEAATDGDKEAGLELARIEGQVRQAEAAGKAGGTVIIGGTTGVIANPPAKTGD